MEVLLIRHTTPEIAKGICYGQADLSLVETYLEEFQHIQEALGIQSFPMIYSSPLQRCSQLAKYLSSQVIFDDRLKELNFGDWELMSWSDINQDDLNIWMNDFDFEKVPNGESYQALQQRCIQFVEEKKQEHNAIVVVTHAGVMRGLWAYVNNIPLKKSFDLKLNYGDHLQLSI